METDTDTGRGESPSGLLAGLRVVDLTDAYGAYCSRVLADLGAEVVRVEAPGGGGGRRRRARRPRRHQPAPPPSQRRQDGAHPRPRRRRFAPSAPRAVGRGRQSWWSPTGGDGRSTTSPPGALAARHGHLVVVALSPFGLTGPASGWTSTELVAQAAAGAVYRSGVPELAPVAAPGSYCEDMGAVTAAMAALLAVHQARVDGHGQVLDVSAVLALAQCSDMSLPLWSLLQFDMARTGAGLYPLFECADGLARVVLPMTPGDWRNLIAWMGSPPEWAGPGLGGRHARRGGT